MTSDDLNDQIFVQIIEKAIGRDEQEITDLQCLLEIFAITGPRTSMGTDDGQRCLTDTYLS